ncbi:MAG: hypothetical protein JNJ73_03620 [Hyphomonadaceae bacterium]|nr:hypothetical protein [Hyphomonadaceae bacterium]
MHESPLHLAPIVTPPALENALCSLNEAICFLARVPLSPPTDPCRLLEPTPLETPSDSRWLLRRLPVMQTLAECEAEGSAFFPQTWPRLVARLGFCQQAGHRGWYVEAWTGDIRAAVKRCEISGRAAEEYVTAWLALKTPALRHVAQIQRRNDRLRLAERLLRDSVIRKGGPAVYGFRDGAFDQIGRPIIVNPDVSWERDPASWLYENVVAFTGNLRTPSDPVRRIMFETDEIRALAERMCPPTYRRRDEPPREMLAPSEEDGGRGGAVRLAARALFGPLLPIGMPAAERDRRIDEYLRSKIGVGASVRTIRDALRHTPWMWSGRRGQSR